MLFRKKKQMAEIEFTKMQGAGNDYIFVNAMKFCLPSPHLLAKQWSDRHTGIGADGLVLIEHSDNADYRMRIFNSDGSEGEMCGNALRCVGKFLYDKDIYPQQKIQIETLAGIKTIWLYPDKYNKIGHATVDMGEPIFMNPNQCTSNLETPHKSIYTSKKYYQGIFVSMGNPHFVIFTDDCTQIDLNKEGPILEHAPIFPQRCNIEFASIISPEHIRARVWERGSGITQACGSGACAVAVAAILKGLCTRRVKIEMDGGVLQIDWCEKTNHILQSGPTTTIYEGKIKYDIQ